MTLDRAIRVLAGALVAISLILGETVSPWARLLAAFVALNLMQSAFTGFCPAESILRKLGVGQPQANKPRSAADSC